MPVAQTRKEFYPLCYGHHQEMTPDQFIYTTLAILVRRRFTLVASPVAWSATTALEGISSCRAEMKSKKKLLLASLARMMGHLCTSLKCSRRTLVIACGDVRNARQAEPMRKASQSANPSEHFMLLEGESLEAWSSGHRYRWDFSMDIHARPAGFPQSSTRTTSWRPTTNFVLSTRWQYTTRASDLTPPSTAVTSTCFPGAQINSVTTRAPRDSHFR